MKRELNFRIILSTILAISLMLLLCSCGKSKPAKDTEALITSIGEVTLQSGPAITEAENHYAALTEQQKNEIENYQALVDARATFDELVKVDNQKKLAADLDARVQRFLDERAHSQAEIDTFLADYESLGADGKAYMKNADKVDAAVELTEYEKAGIVAARALRGSLKYGNSLELNSIKVAESNGKTASPYYADISYSAMNGFGAMQDDSEIIDVTTTFKAGFWEVSRVLSGHEEVKTQLLKDYISNTVNETELDPQRVMSNIDETF